MKQEIVEIQKELTERIAEKQASAQNPRQGPWEYIDHAILPVMEEKLKSMIEWLKEKFKKKMANPDKKTQNLLDRGVKVQGLKRMVFGFRETLKHLKIHTAQLVIIATNIMKTSGPEGTDSAILEILKFARSNSVPVIFCFKKYELG